MKDQWESCPAYGDELRHGGLSATIVQAWSYDPLDSPWCIYMDKMSEASQFAPGKYVMTMYDGRNNFEDAFAQTAVILEAETLETAQAVASMLFKMR
jgi:hypothetical protein